MKEGQPTTGPKLGFDTNKIWQEVQANKTKRESCAGHDFVCNDTPIKLGSKWTCSKCNCVERGDSIYWYLQGVKHGRASR